MKIFLSSTCYDLVDLRAELERYLVEKGHQLLLSDRSNFPVEIGVHRHDVCINSVRVCDLFILFVDGRFGAPYYRNEDISITWAEFRTAIESHKRIIAFVRKDVFMERQTFQHNLKKGNSFSPFYADNTKVFEFIDEIQKNEGGYWIEPFENSVEVRERLENLYETNHSLLNTEVAKMPIYIDSIPLTALSGSTASFITKFVTDDPIESIDDKILNKAIESIPDGLKPYGEIMEFEKLPGSNAYYYFQPLRSSGEDGEIIIGISPTALGNAVKNELLDLKKNLEKKNGD